MLLEENCDTEKKVVIQVEEDGEYSRMDNSVKTQSKADNYVSEESNKGQKNSDSEKSQTDSGKHSRKTEHTDNETENVRNLNIIALERTETEQTNNETGQPERDGQDTDDEVAEEIFSETDRTDRTRTVNRDNEVDNSKSGSFPEEEVEDDTSNVNSKRHTDDDIIEELGPESHADPVDEIPGTSNGEESNFPDVSQFCL